MNAFRFLTFFAVFALLNFCAFLAREVADGILTVRISRTTLFTISNSPP